MSKEIFELDFNGRRIVVEIGEVAKQADGSALVRYDDTVVLATACASKQAKDVDFFPLTVTFEEKLYSVGKIPGSFLKREGRPSEHATLTARLIDRPIRPLFDEGFRNEVQIINTVLSVDPNANVEMTALLASSIALSISDIPFSTPVAGVEVGYIDGKFIINPDAEQTSKSLLALSVAGTKQAINMVEAGAKELDEDTMLEAVMYGHEQIKILIDFIDKIVKKVGKPKRAIELYKIDGKIEKDVTKTAKKRIIEAIKIKEKLPRYAAIETIFEEVITDYETKTYPDEKAKAKTLQMVKDVLHNIEKEEVRRLITVDKIRPDGRRLDEVRPLSSAVDILPRVHGSALFTRGETQVLSICTLGPLGDQQILDGLNPLEESKRFMHHYNFPPFSVGEVGRTGNPGRREIGHGALGERALAQIIPSIEDFPYTIRLVAEVLESNGSSSQASICASCMALMAAGVPISAPVSGIAMGLVTSGDITNNAPYTILTDIQGMEDHLGDMDFKVAGTTKGITALQMDIKITGINREILKEALAQAKIGRAHILEHMLKTIPTYRSELGKYTPKFKHFTIPTDKIREVIGQGGKVINEIIAQCNGIKIDIEQDGTINLYHSDQEMIDKAYNLIYGIAKVAKVGEIYKGKVNRLEVYGAFVNLFGQVDGLLHVSRLDNVRIENIAEYLKIGDEITVIVTEIDEKGKVSVSHKELLKEGEHLEKKYPGSAIIAQTPKQNSFNKKR